MRHVNVNWKIMNDTKEDRRSRVDAEAEIREMAWVGMYPSGRLNKALVLAACQRVRNELGIEIGPQPIRFTEEELNLVMAAVDSIEHVGPEQRGALIGAKKKLHHRDRTLRNTLNREVRTD